MSAPLKPSPALLAHAQERAQRFPKVDVLDNRPTFASIEGDALCDITIVCEGGSFRAEKSILGRASEPLLKMVTAPMMEGLSGTIRFPDFSVKTVQHVYRRIKDILISPSRFDIIYLLGEKPNPRPDELHCRWFMVDDKMEAPLENLRFAHMFSVEPIVHLIKAEFLYLLPSQAIFDADKKYSLGIRAALIRNVLLHLNSGQIALPMQGDPGSARATLLNLTDPEIYIELWNQIFKPLASCQESGFKPSLFGKEQDFKPDSLRKDMILIHHFIQNFANSGLHPSTLGVERIGRFREDEILEIVSNISDPAERWEFLCRSRGITASMELLAEIRKKRASEELEEQSLDGAEKSKRARSEKN